MGDGNPTISSTISDPGGYPAPGRAPDTFVSETASGARLTPPLPAAFFPPFPPSGALASTFPCLSRRAPPATALVAVPN